MHNSLPKMAVCLIFLFVVSEASAQDGLKGLKDYLKQYKYSTFIPPRENAVVGSIVNYDNGFESVVSTKCLPLEKIKPSSLAPVALPDHDGTLGKDIGLEGSFAKALDPKIDLKGAYKDSRVQKITVHISDPKEAHIESADVKDYIASLPKGTCRDAATNKRNRIIAWVLQIDSITYTFLDKDGKDITLDAGLLSAINLSPKFHKDFDRKDSLSLKKPIFMGYRAWRAGVIPGAISDQIDLKESSPEEISDLKNSKGKSVGSKN